MPEAAAAPAAPAAAKKAKNDEPSFMDKYGGAIGGGLIGLASPFIAKGLGSLFGLDEPSDAEKRATALREASLQRLRDAAEGKTASPAQLAAFQQQQRTVNALASMAQKGTVQQRAGNVRAAMQATPEVMAQQGAVAAQTRAAEMSNARSQLAGQEMAAANAEAAAGLADRQYTQKLIGAGISGGAAMAGDAFLKKPEQPKTDAKTDPKTENAAGAASALAASAVATPASAAPAASPVAAQAAPAANPFQFGPGQQDYVTPYQSTAPLLGTSLTQPTLGQQRRKYTLSPQLLGGR